MSNFYYDNRPWYVKLGHLWVRLVTGWTTQQIAIADGWLTRYEIPAGRYKHFKGGEYYVDFVVEHTETHEGIVIYHPSGEAALWARPLASWHKPAIVDGRTVQRFVKMEAAHV